MHLFYLNIYLFVFEGAFLCGTLGKIYIYNYYCINLPDGLCISQCQPLDGTNRKEINNRQ